MKRNIIRTRLTALAVTALLVPAGFALADTLADLTGTWTVKIVTGQGDFDTTWELEQAEDGTLTGSIEGQQGAAPVDEGGWVDGDSFGFSVTRDFNGQTVQIEYEGTFTEEALEGTLSAGGGQFTAEFTGVRAATEGVDR